MNGAAARLRVVEPTPIDRPRTGPRLYAADLPALPVVAAYVRDREIAATNRRLFNGAASLVAVAGFCATVILIAGRLA